MRARRETRCVLLAGRAAAPYCVLCAALTMIMCKGGPRESYDRPRPNMIDASLFDRLGLTNAVRDELALRNSLLPRRWDYEALSPHHEEVAKLLSPRLRRAVSGQAASVVWGVSRILDRFSVVDQAAAAAVRYSLRASCGVR